MAAVVTGATQLLGVIGCPIEHSLSPVMHNAAIATLSQDRLSHIYVPLHIAPEHLEQAIEGLAAAGFQGFNVTIPHKQTIMPLLCDISPVAQAAGAVNTVWRTDRGWAGTNTDIQGFLAPLLSLLHDGSTRTVTLLGSGGAARAVIAACTQLEGAIVQVVGRNLERLENIKADFSTLPLNIQTFPWSALSSILAQTDLLVNTTPMGMYPLMDQSPVPATMLMQLPKTAIVYDLIYTPNPTQLLQQAQDLGYQTIHGLEMLVQQGAAALEIWLNQPVPIETMRAAAQAQLAPK
jgi:shikimate dehydrogenase